MGFDARLQFLHPSDAVRALLWATREELPGTYNVAADDIVTLSQAIRMMGRPSVSVPQVAAPTMAGLIRQARLGDFSADMVDALTYGRAMATDRFARATAGIDGTGFVPAYTSRQCVEEFVGVSRPGLLDPVRVSSALDTIEGALSVPTSGSGHG
jgi:UDP-glucose 4-epimerase